MALNLKAFEQVSTPTLTTVSAEKGPAQRLDSRRPPARRRNGRASSAPPSPSTSSPPARISPCRKPGPRRSRPAPPSRRLRRARSSSPMRSASPTQAFSAIFSARAWSSAAWPASSPTASCAISPACATTGLPVWAQGFAAPPSVAGLIFTGWDQPIGCGGVAIYPGDIIVADADGAVVVPAALAEEVATLAQEQERLEAWILGEVAKGVRPARPLPAQCGDAGAV